MKSLHLSNPWVRLAIAVITFVVFGVAWWLISPLFINNSVSEGFPTLAPMSTKTEAAAASLSEATATPQAAATAEPTEDSSDAMPEGDGLTLVSQGEFYDLAHHGEGSASVYSFSDGSRVLRFENFQVLNGPDLHVYLAAQDPVPNTVGQELIGYVDLGALKGNIGDQNYDIPEGVDLADYPSVVIWCVPFRVPFSAASLMPAQ